MRDIVHFEFTPKKYLIEGGNGKEKYSATSIVNIVHEAAERAFIKKKSDKNTGC